MYSGGGGLGLRNRVGIVTSEKMYVPFLNSFVPPLNECARFLVTNLKVRLPPGTTLVVLFHALAYYHAVWWLFSRRVDLRFSSLL